MNTISKKYPFWSIYYEDEGFNITGDRIMGRQAAGWSYLNAHIKHYDHLSVYLKYIEHKDMLISRIKPILNESKKTLDLKSISYTSPHLSEEYGGIFYPGPGISEFATHRSYYGHDKYSLIGITHTTASERVMQSIAKLPFSNIMPWDSIICTSECVYDTVNKIIDHEIDKISSKISVKDIILPKLPIIPLGVDKNEFDYNEENRKQSRTNLGIKDNDIVLSYVGRLSFHAKAHHLPMYLAIESCAQQLKKDQKIHIIQTGWFANDFVKNAFIEEGKKVCPSIEFHFLDGKDQNNKHLTLSSADIFISLSDNIQETFGITPLEGMAAGLPVLVSDWNGYKYTVRDGIDGYRVKTYSLGKGYGTDIAHKHMMTSIDYDNYIGMSVQRIAVDVKDCINKLSDLITSKEKRLEFGKNAKKHINDNYDWPIILRQYEELSEELNQIRLKESKKYKEFCKPCLPSENLDPFYIFASYPSEIIKSDYTYYKTEMINKYSIKDVLAFNSINYANHYLPSELELKSVYYAFDKNGKKLSDVMKETNFDEEIVLKCCVWLLKYGYLTSIGD